MPAWLAWLAFLIAFINLAFVPAMFFGYDAAQFYSAVGWGTTATAPVLVVCWILIASIIMLRTPPGLKPDAKSGWTARSSAKGCRG